MEEIARVIALKRDIMNMNMTSSSKRIHSPASIFLGTRVISRVCDKTNWFHFRHHPYIILSFLVRFIIVHTTMAAPDSNALHPPRLAPMFARSPTNPGTPVHSIQTMRRKSAGHGGPLTKILVANRGV